MQLWLRIALLALAPIVAGQSPIPDPAAVPARVSGTVVDERDGRPLSHVTVCFVLDRNGFDDATNSHCDETDTRGIFNIADLPPGRFALRADRPGYFASEPPADGLPAVVSLSAGDEIRDVKLRMSRAGVIAGRVVYADGEPFSGATLTLNGRYATGLQTATNDLGEYRFANLRPDDYAVKVQVRGQPSDRLADCEQFAKRNLRLYVQQSTDRSTLPTHVSSGQTAVPPDLVMIQVAPRRVTGRIVWDEYPLPGRWWVHGADQTVESKMSDGSFSLCGVPPGEHTLEISAVVAGRMVAGDVKIQVADEDLKEVEIVPEISAIIRAQIDVEDNLPLDLSRVQIVGGYLSGGGLGPNPHNSVPDARPNPDGTFFIQNLYTGEYRFALSQLPPGTFLKSVKLGGQDFLEAPLMVRGGEAIDGLVFTVSTKAGRVNGVVKDEAGLPVPDGFIWLQPDPPHMNPEIHVCDRTADQNGAFTCSNLSPGKYRIAAWRKAPDLPDLAKTVSSSGTPVEIPESGEVTVTVPLINP